MLRSLLLTAKRTRRVPVPERVATESSPQVTEKLSESVLDNYMKSKDRGLLGGWSTKWSAGSEGYEVPYKFRIETSNELVDSETKLGDLSKMTYTNFIGNRYPTLETAENYRYWKERSLDRLLPKVFPIFVPTHRRIHPLLRAYIFYLNDADPGRFTVRRIAERYAIKEYSVLKIIREYKHRKFLESSGLASRNFQQITKEQKVMDAKEKAYAKAVGYEIIGNQDIEDEREMAEEFDGVTSTSDFVRQQSIEVESFSAFPLPEKRNPVLKRVDVDLPVAHTARAKIVNWIDPTERIVF